jgi:hypothetical protein
MTVHNALLFNAALDGFVAGSVAGQGLTDTTSADYAGLVASATNYATEVDSLIGNDSTISQGSGAAIYTGFTSAIVENQSAKVALIESLSFSAAFQRYQANQTQAQVTPTAEAVVALYTEAIASLQLS